MKKLINKLVHFFTYAIFVLTLISILICVVVYSVKYKDIFSIKECFWFIPALLLTALTVYIAKRAGNNNMFILGMILTQVMISAVMIFSYNTKPVSDYEVIWKSAQQMFQGSFVSGMIPATYMYVYNWQLGIAAFESIGISLGMDFFAFKILNAFIVCLFCYLEYRLVKRKGGEQAAQFAYVIATFFLPWILTIPQFTNHHIGLVFLLIILYLLDKKTWWAWGLAGSLTAVFNVLRPMGILVVLTAIGMAVYDCIAERRMGRALPAIIFVSVYCVGLSAFNTVFIDAGYTDMKISDSRVPYYKFQKGLYGYNTPAEDLTSQYDNDIDAYNEAMKEQLFDELRDDPIGVCVFVANKMVRYLGLFDYQFEMTYDHDVQVYTKYPIKALYCTSWFQYITIIVLAFIGYRSYNKRNRIDVYQIFFVGNTLVYIFIEAFSSYRFESYSILIMFAALGMDKIVDCLPAGARRTV